MAPSKWYVVEHLAIFHDALPDTPEEVVAAAKENELVWLFDERLHDLIAEKGAVKKGPRQVHPYAISSSYLVELYEDLPLSLLSGEYSTVQVPEGLIFDSGCHLYHVHPECAVPLAGEVLHDVFSRRHLDVVPNIEVELWYRLIKYVADRFMENDAIVDETFCREYLSLIKKHLVESLTWSAVEAAAEQALQYYYCLPRAETET